MDRALIFTEDNAMAYRIARRLLIPPITHQTKVSERSQILAAFERGGARRGGDLQGVERGRRCTFRQRGDHHLGSGSVREHVQRLGRILRKGEGKRALLYELITDDTAEGFISARRRAHEAYTKAPE